MGHHILALIGKVPYSIEAADKYELPCFEENGFVIVALDPSHSDYWCEKLGFTYSQKSGVFMDSEVVHFFAGELGLDDFTIIFTDYFGGLGDQKAVAYVAGEKFEPASKRPINAALKKIGVRSGFLQDEFDAINLNKYRDWDDLFEKYEDL